MSDGDPSKFGTVAYWKARRDKDIPVNDDDDPFEYGSKAYRAKQERRELVILGFLSVGFALMVWIVWQVA